MRSGRMVGRRFLRAVVLVSVWAAIVGVGVAGVELFARNRQGNPYFFELDRLKVYNRRFYEEKRAYFRNWPIPLELFDADKPTPRYLFKPNLRMALRNRTELEPARAGDVIYKSTNSWGFRGPEFSIKKPAGVIRIVCLGASTTEGSQGDLETYPYFLQQELNPLFPGRRIEVLNAGHHGQLIEDLLEILRQRVLPLEPDIVIFYEASNDLKLREFTRIDLSCNVGSCVQKVYQAAFMLFHRRSAAFRIVAARMGLEPPQGRPLWYSFDDSSPKPGAVHYEDTLRQIVREARDHGSRVVLSSFITVAHEGLTVRREDHPLLYDHLHRVLYPFSPGELQRAYAYYNRIVREVAREFDVPFVDAASIFPRDVKYFPYDIIHFSPEGNRILARIFAKQLRELLLSDRSARRPR